MLFLGRNIVIQKNKYIIKNDTQTDTGGVWYDVRYEEVVTGQVSPGSDHILVHFCGNLA